MSPCAFLSTNVDFIVTTSWYRVLVISVQQLFKQMFPLNGILKRIDVSPSSMSDETW
jgi:hypothetical protein